MKERKLLNNAYGILMLVVTGITLMELNEGAPNDGWVSFLLTPPNFSLVFYLMTSLAFVLIALALRNRLVTTLVIVSIMIDSYFKFFLDRSSYQVGFVLLLLWLVVLSLLLVLVFRQTKYYRWLGLIGCLWTLLLTYFINVGLYYALSDYVLMFDSSKEYTIARLNHMRGLITIPYIFHWLILGYRTKPHGYVEQYDDQGNLLPFNYGVANKITLPALLVCLFLPFLGLVYVLMIRKQLPNRAKPLASVVTIGLVFYGMAILQLLMGLS